MTAMTISVDRDMEALWDRQREQGPTPCQENPIAYDPPSVYSSVAYRAAEQAAEACLTCPALKECAVVAFNHPELRGVIAGQVRHPNPRGRRPRVNKEQENNPHE